MAKIKESNDRPLIEVISKPVIPAKRKPNKKIFILPSGIVIGLVTDFLLAFLQSWSKGILS